jgi:hypothetical protein
LVANGAEPCDETSTRLIVSESEADGWSEPRNVMVPLTTLALAAAAGAAAPSVVCDEPEELQPARASAVTVISDQTALRMGKPQST